MMKILYWLLCGLTAFLVLLMVTAIPQSGSTILASPLPAMPQPLAGGGVWSMAGTGFVSEDGENSYEYQSWGGVKLTGVSGTSPWSFMNSSVELPDGATITSLTVYYDDSDLGADVTLYLRRNDGTGGYNDIASVGSFSTPGMGSETTTIIITPGSEVVDTFGYNYTLTAGFGSANVTLYGAKITYTLPVGMASMPAPTAAGETQALAAVDPAVAGLAEAEGAALYNDGQTVFLAPPPAGPAGARKETQDRAAALDSPSSAGVELGPLGGEAVYGWRAHTIAGSNFHPLNASTNHEWAAGGGRCVTSGSTWLVAPLDLIHGQTVHWIRFTFLDQSPENASMYLYRVDRQGNGDYPWSYNSDVSGGYFTTASPYMELTIDNHNYAYYFAVELGSSAAGNDLCALEIAVIYGDTVYLPLILKNS